jgi:CSLREA domain-containing protein
MEENLVNRRQLCQTITRHILVKGIRLLAVAALVAGSLFAVQPARPAYAATLTVTTVVDELASPGMGCSLREAITNANNNANTYPECYMSGSYGNDTITFAPATMGIPIVLTRGGGSGEDFNVADDLDILAAGGNLIIQGRGATNTIIDGAGGAQVRVFHVFPDLISSNTCTFDSLTIRNGGGNVISYGGGIYNHYGTVTVDNSTVSNNHADACGGGIYNDHGTLIVQNGSVIGGAGAGNTADNAGGGIYNYYGAVTVDNSTISNNTAQYASPPSGNGGGIFNIGTLNIQNGSVIGGAGAGNRAAYNGGGIYNSVGATTVVNSTIRDNEVSYEGFILGKGGGIYNSTGCTVTVDNSTVSNNTSHNGSSGGIFNYGTLFVQNGSTIGGAGAGNRAFYSPGGIWNNIGGATTVTGSRILYNTATTGVSGGIGNSENTADALSVTGSCIVGNSASSFFNDETALQTATGNWWGAATGPNTPGADTTSGNVDTSDFLTAPILGCPSGGGSGKVYLPIVVRN